MDRGSAVAESATGDPHDYRLFLDIWPWILTKGLLNDANQQKNGEPPHFLRALKSNSNIECNFLIKTILPRPEYYPIPKNFELIQVHVLDQIEKWVGFTS